MHMKTNKRHIDSHNGNLVDVVEIDRIQLQRSLAYRNYLTDFLRRDNRYSLKIHDGLFTLYFSNNVLEFTVDNDLLIRDSRKMVSLSNVDEYFLGRYHPIYVDSLSSFPNKVGSFIRIFSVDDQDLVEPVDAMVIPPSNYDNFTYPEVRTVDQSEFMDSKRSFVQLDRVTRWMEVHLV